MSIELSPLAQRMRETIRLDPGGWARACGIRLRPYQARIGQAIKDSILHKRGLSLVVILPRQSGKNELQAHLMAWLLFRYAGSGGRIVSVSPTYKPQTINSIDRLSRSLDGCVGTRRRWRLKKGYIFTFGKASAWFFSADPAAKVVGATADLLLSVDEAQEVNAAKFDKDFDPMTASTNATRVFWGTAWTANTLLERQRRLALQAQEEDGVQRVFFYTAEDVMSLVPDYRMHLERVIMERGRNHPLVRSQYFCETIDVQGGMFHAGRMGLMFTTPSTPPTPPNPPISKYGNGGGEMRYPVAFLIDVAGMDEANTGLAASLLREGLGNPGRDATTVTVVRIDLSSLESLKHPSYRVVERQAWTGESHLAVFGKIKALAEAWQPLKIVIDASGVGEGLWSLLEHAFPTRVTAVKFSAQEKSEIGWRFLAIIETGRFSDPGASEAVREQYQACVSEILPGPGKRLKWGVPDGTRNKEGELIHDDYVMADALCAVLDRLEWVQSTEVVSVEGSDPLDRLG